MVMVSTLWLLFQNVAMVSLSQMGFQIVANVEKTKCTQISVGGNTLFFNCLLHIHYFI